ncbi:MAG: exodeoxyribonuclease VII large subunit [Bacteroidales bacterium]|nr:exodeoxyribonuclease VII large subunit [Bacteroidales bacterium]MCF8390188.1 exodeoxyribonuclease VII large subunit [Bacteroidales bacterium]
MSAKSSNNNPSQKAISLSELSRKIKSSLNDSFPEKFWLIGEISEIRQHSNGHVYIELTEKAKNADKIAARIKATIWSYTYRMLRPYFEGSTGYELSPGIKIMVLASLEYHPQYSISLNITDIDPSYTLGELAQKKEEVIQRLIHEGVMNMNKELDLPMVIQNIAVISSESAAGYEDFLNSLENNIYNFHFNINLFPALMQGDKAEESIIAMLEKIYDSGGNFDLVVVIRGGGAKIDLECFNSYDLAYYITQFPIPILTGIGHERDETIADLVAHTKLKTPTAVAEFLIDRMVGFSALLNELQESINFVAKAGIVQSEKNMNRFSIALYNSIKSKLSDHQNKLNSLAIQTENKSRRLVFSKTTDLNRNSQQLRSWLKSGLRIAMDKQDANSRILRMTIPRFISKENHKLENRLNALKILDPVNILKRGYSISYLNGILVKDSGDLNMGDEVKTRLYKGEFISKVTKK